MRAFYTAPTATVEATPPGGSFDAVVCPGTPAISLVIVHDWASNAAEDTWEDLPNVVQRYPEDWGAQAPAGVITAFAPWGATTGMTIREVLRLIRRHWPPCRP